MTESSNMICPSCGTFQKRAEVCNKCNVIIAKVLNATDNVVEKKSIESEISKPLVPKFAVIILIAIPIIGFILFTGTNEDTENSNNVNDQRKTNEMKPIDKIAAYNPAIANNIQRNNVMSKLHTLRTELNMYLVEGEEPPSNEEGLQSLVDKGYLSQLAITDEWGKIFEYRLEWGKENPWGKEYEIFVHSKGPDGISGNSDDVGM